MRSILTVFIFFIAFSAGALEPGRFTEADYNPDVLKTGMKCFVRISVSDDLDISDAGDISIENSKWFHLLDIRVNYDEDEILLWFIPLDPSMAYLPQIRAGKYIYPHIPVSIESVLTDQNLSDPGTPAGVMLLLPGTRMLFAFMAAVFISVLFLSLLILKKLPGKIIKILNLRKQGNRRKELLLILERIADNPYEAVLRDKAGMGKTAAGVVSGKIAKSLKEFLEIVTEKRITCLTTEEIVKVIEHPPADELFFLDTLRFSPLSSASPGGFFEKNEGPDSFRISVEAKLKETAQNIYSFALSLEKADKIEKREKGENSGV